MSEQRSNEDLFDTRKIDRFIAEEKVTREQYDAWLASLEDCSANADTSAIRFINNDRHRGAAATGGSDDEES